VAGRLKHFVALLMAVLALEMGPVQTVCAANNPVTDTSCCCPDCSTSNCQPEKSCASCSMSTHHQEVDVKLPVRTMAGAFASKAHFLFLIAGVTVHYPAFVSVVRSRDVNVSPPFGGHPPQAVLSLWLI
jgi:hypothetical protein